MYKIYWLLFLSIYFPAPVTAQEYFHEPSEEPIREKIFVHIDRPAYIAGETMWFKINVVNGKDFAPLNLSKVVYLEILDNNNDTPVQIKVPVSKGFGSGSVYLPLSLKSGNYIVRAYTNWMKNFGAEHFFEEEISIVNTFYKSSAKKEEAEKPAIDIQFFPEGGSLVYGLRSKVAFRGVGLNGKGVAFEGALINEKRDTVCLFKPSKFGIGYFYYTPVENSRVQAIIKTKTDSIVSNAMPVPLNEGYVMQVTDSLGAEIKVSIQANENIKENLTVVASSSRGAKILEKRMMENGMVTFSINKNKFDEGVSKITIFDSGIQPLMERLYFKYPSHSLNIKVNTNKDNFTKREKVDLRISLRADKRVSPSLSNLSMAIYRQDSLNKKNLSNIYNYFWLSSDLRGAVESPNFYFENVTDSTIVAMDNLMLTHGWRKFHYEKQDKGTEQPYNYIPEYEGLTIRGRLERSAPEVNLANTPLYLARAGKIAHLYGSRSDENGNFYFVTENLFDYQKLVIQTDTAHRDKISNIRLEDPFLKSYSNKKAAPLSLSKGYANSIRTRHVQMQTQNIYWEDEKSQLVAVAIDSSHFYDYLDNSYLLDNYTRFPTTEEVMREYIPEVVVRKTNENFNFRIVRAHQILHTDNPLVLLNNIPVFNINTIIEYNPYLIEQIDIIKDGYILEGAIVQKGILNYKTYTNKLEDLNLDAEATILDFEGLQIPRDFYSPMYGDKDISSTKPDFRNLLMWEPSIVISGTESKELSFYTSDLSGKYIGIVQGINNKGEVGFKTFSFEVADVLTRE